MTRRSHRFATTLALVCLAAGTTASAQESAPPHVPGAIRDRAEREGFVPVIVHLRLSTEFRPEADLPSASATRRQREQIAAHANRVLSSLPNGSYRLRHRFATVPYVAIELTRSGIAALDASADVARVLEDTIVQPVLAESVPLIQADQAWDSGDDGTGTVIAILDTGVDGTHPMLAGKVVEEACYSSTVTGTSVTVCPNGLEEQIGPGAAVPCTLSECIHGTHVAGIAAGNGAQAGQSFSGVAKGAQLMAVQVFSKITSPLSCGFLAPCAGAFTSDVVAGLERVYAVAATRRIAAVNMSLGGGSFEGTCDDQPYKPIIDNLRAIGIATVVASGNDGSTAAMASPACVSSAISVGSTDKNDAVSYFSNVSTNLSLFAPGGQILSAAPGVAYQVLSGTSMAAPHVAGAWGILRGAAPSASVDAVLNALRTTGKPITDTRLFGTTVVPRIRTFQALATLVPVTSPAPEISALSPTHARAGTPVSISVTGSGFNALSVARWNGVARPTEVISTTRLVATITAGDLPAGGSADLSVFNPAPGGGASSSLPFTIDPPPTLTPSVLAVAPGSPVTVTLANGYGSTYDWLSLAATGSADNSYQTWTYVGAGVTDRTWTVTMPTTVGTYEFRLFVNNARKATSAAVTIDPSLNPIPVVSSLSPAASVVGTGAFTLTVNGRGFIAGSVVLWNGAPRTTTFVSSGQLRAAVNAADISALGTAQVSVFTPAPGGGVSATLPFTIAPPPSLSVSSTTVVAGMPVTVTLTNGVGGSTDWLAFASSSSPNTGYLNFKYVGAGVTSSTWTVTTPAIAGTYEFRLFLSNTYTRAATSPRITVLPGPPTLTSLNPTGAPPGGAAFTLAVNGTGFVSTSIVNWNGSPRTTTYVSGNQLRAAIAASDVDLAGTAQVTVTTPPINGSGGTSNALPFTITTPVLSVSTTSVQAGSNVTVTLTNGFGGSTDWLAFALTTAANTSYAAYTYVGAGVATRTWTIAAPPIGGTYEFRLFVNNSYTRAATSPPVTVIPGPNPTPVLTSLSPSRALAGSSSVTISAIGSGFVPSSVIQWNGGNRTTTFVSTTQLQTTLSAADLATIGTALVSVSSPAPGGGASSALTFTIAPPPTLSVDATSVRPGATVTVTLSGGLGGYWDWLALSAVGAANTSYVQYTYVGSGVVTRTWTVTMPSTAGSYEFRLYLNASFTIAARSPAVTVAP